MNATKKTPDIAVATNIDGIKTPVEMVLGALEITFKNGKMLVLDAELLTPEILTIALMHGLKQKLVDSAAITRDPETGRQATIETKYDAVKAVLDRLQSGEWNKRREGGVTGGLLLRALIRMYAGRKTPEQLREYLESKTDKEKAALRKNPKVAEHIETIRAEDAAESGDDLPDLLAELED